MVDLVELHKVYEKFQKYKELRKRAEKELKIFFSEHKSEIPKLDIEYSSLDFSTDEPKKFLSNNRVLWTFMNLKVLKNEIEKQIKECLSVTNYVKNNGKIVYTENTKKGITKKYFIDLETKEEVSLTEVSDKEIEFLITILDKANSYVCPVEYRDLTLLTNIINDIKYKNTNKETSNKEITNEYIRAKKKIKSYNNTNIVLIKSVIDSYGKDASISDEEYNINVYMKKVIDGEDILMLYTKADNINRKYIIDAYIRLSSYKYYDTYRYHFRTDSTIINDKVYMRTNKKDSE